MAQRWKKPLLLAVVLFAALQGVRQSVPNPPVLADVTAPPEVKEILRTACYSCHSNETRIPWFDQVVPAYWLMARDVKKGRRHLNFSELGQRTPEQQKAALWEAVNHIRLGTMPPRAYTRVHPQARVTPAQLSVLEGYLRGGVPARPAQANDGAAESTRPAEIPAAPNGIAFFTEYKRWMPVGATDRFDNGTLRLVLGNEEAQKAIASHETTPWPEGTVFAKVIWEAVQGPDGAVHPGAFKAVEFMQKDTQRFASTQGWGWARWLGPSLTPYGQDAGFTHECTGCHEPLEKADYVFTLPGETTLPAQVTETLEGMEAQGVTLEESADTISVLYGGDGVRKRIGWKRRDDPHWFGARIPGELLSVETAARVNDAILFQRLEGTPLRPFALSEADQQARGAGLLDGAAPELP